MNPPGDRHDERTATGRHAPRPALGHTLPPGTRLLDYEVAGLVGEGGFGIVYLAWDHSLQRQVAIKEYMPASMASRAAGSSAIVVKSDRHLDPFKAGLKSFVNEARLLARFDHPALVKVYRFWEENGTAYMAMPFYQGPTLKAALADLGRRPSEAEVLAWLRPLLDALSVMHAAHCYHRDIAPDNILLTPTGPLLLDFGAARRVIGDMTHALTVVLKPGYAPIEQYGDVASMAQGAWTDLYALACVVYFAATGRTPTSSVERLMDDRLERLATIAAGRYSEGFLRAIDAALSVRPQDRPQTGQQFRALLDECRIDDGAPVDSRFGVLAVPTSASMPLHPITERGSYPTVPGSLRPDLPTQLITRAPSPAPTTTPMPLAVVVDDDETTQPAPPRPAARIATQAAPATGPAPAPTTTTRVAPVTRPAPGPAQAPKSKPAPSSRRMGWIVAIVVATVLVVAAVVGWRSGRQPGAAPATAIEGTAGNPPPTPTIDAVAPAPQRPPTAPADAAPTPASPTAVAEPTPAPASAAVQAPAIPSQAPAPAPSPAPAPTLAPAPAPAPPSSPARVERAPAPRPTPAPAVDAPPRRAVGARCSDILQKASLEPLTADEAAYLRRECR